MVMMGILAKLIFMMDVMLIMMSVTLRIVMMVLNMALSGMRTLHQK